MRIKELLEKELESRMQSDVGSVLIRDSAKGRLDRFAIEKKYNGFRAVIHKRGELVKIFSDQAKDITSAFPTTVSQASRLSKDDYIIDCELVPHEDGKPLGRDVASRYVGAVKSGKPVDDSGVIFFAFDCLYLGKDITGMPWSERKKALHSLNFTDNIKEVGTVIVDNREDATKAIGMFKDMKGSEGAVIKRLDGRYTKGKESDSWIKYRVLIDLDVLVTKVNAVIGETKGRNYTIGIYLKDTKGINPNYMYKYDNKDILKLGNTFNTGLSASIGDIIKIQCEEVWRHKYDDGSVRYSIHKPHVKELLGNGETSSIDTLESYVVSRGVEVKEEEMDEGKELDSTTNFPDRMQKYFNKLKDVGEWMPFVMQWHYRGHEITDEERKSISSDFTYKLDSLHTDLRLSVGDHLEGITILSPTTADQSIEDKVFKGKLKNVRAILKVPQPKQWLSAHGFMEKGEPGTTERSPAYMIVIAKGQYKPVVVEDHSIIIETKSDSGDAKVGKDEIESHGLYITRFPNDTLRDLPRYIQFQIAHISDKHIILVNERDKVEEHTD